MFTVYLFYLATLLYILQFICYWPHHTAPAALSVVACGMVCVAWPSCFSAPKNKTLVLNLTMQQEMDHETWMDKIACPRTGQLGDKAWKTMIYKQSAEQITPKRINIRCCLFVILISICKTNEIFSSTCPRHQNNSRTVSQQQANMTPVLICAAAIWDPIRQDNRWEVTEGVILNLTIPAERKGEEETQLTGFVHI